MRWTLFLAAASLMCAPGVRAQQHEIDTRNSTLTIHVGKTGALAGLGHEHEVRARESITVPRTRARILRLRYTWIRGRCA